MTPGSGLLARRGGATTDGRQGIRSYVVFLTQTAVKRALSRPGSRKSLRRVVLLWYRLCRIPLPQKLL